MGQIQTDELQIIYDAISTIFDVFEVGGQLAQQQNLITGEYEPDRTICPLMLTPSLMVSDPNIGTVGVESIDICSVQWTVEDGQGVSTVITEEDYDDEDPYYRDGVSLVIQQNVPAGEYRKISVQVTYVDPYAGRKVYNKVMALNTTAITDFIPALSVDTPPLLTANPFHFATQGTQHTVTAKFMAGETDLSDNANMVYVWEKRDGTTFRAIDETDIDVESASGKTMVVNLDAVKSVMYRLTAYHSTYQDKAQQVVFGFDRKLYGGRIKMGVVRGKILKAATKESEAEVALYVNSNKVGEAASDTRDAHDFYRFEWSFKIWNGPTLESTTDIGWGKSVVVDRSISGTSKTKTPQFVMNAHELSEMRALVYDGKILKYNNKIVAGQVMID